MGSCSSSNQGVPKLLQGAHVAVLKGGTAVGCSWHLVMGLYLLRDPRPLLGLRDGEQPLGMPASGAGFSPRVLRDAKSPGSGSAKHLCMHLTLSTGVILLISLGLLTRLRTWLIWKKSAQHETGPSPLLLGTTLQSLSASLFFQL